MTGTILLVVLIAAAAALLATNARDDLQDVFMRRRKPKTIGSARANFWLMLLLAPVVAYLIIGTVLFVLLSTLEAIAKRFRRYGGEDHVEAIAWHEVGPLLTLLFPVTWPILTALLILVLFKAIAVAVGAAAKRLVVTMLRLVRRIWVIIVHAARAVLAWLTAVLRYVWAVVLEGMHAVWDMIVQVTDHITAQIAALARGILGAINGAIHAVFEQIIALLHNIRATFNARMRL